MNTREAIIKAIKSQEKIQVFWGIVKKVNEQDCVVESMVDGLEYENTMFGLGENIIKPKNNTKVLCGIVNNSLPAFLIYIEEIETINLIADEITFNGNINLGDKNTEKAVKGESLNNLLQELITHLQTLNATLISYGTAQAAELPVIAASNTVLVSSMAAETAKIASWIAKLQNNLSNNVKLK